MSTYCCDENGEEEMERGKIKVIKDVDKRWASVAKRSLLQGKRSGTMSIGQSNLEWAPPPPPPPSYVFLPHPLREKDSKGGPT